MCAECGAKVVRSLQSQQQRRAPEASSSRNEKATSQKQNADFSQRRHLPAGDIASLPLPETTPPGGRYRLAASPRDDTSRREMSPRRLSQRRHLPAGDIASLPLPETTPPGGRYRLAASPRDDTSRREISPPCGRCRLKVVAIVPDAQHPAAHVPLGIPALRGACQQILKALTRPVGRRYFCRRKAP